MKLIRWGFGKHTYHWCPGCECLHVIPPEGWTRTGPDELPTYAPSFLQYPTHKHGRCHYLIQGGNLVFQPDCAHSLRGLVAMPDVPQSEVDRLTKMDSLP